MEGREIKWTLNSSGPTKLFAKGRKDMSGANDGGNLGYAASDRQQGTTCVLGKDWPDGSKDAEQCTGWLGAVPVGF